MMMINLDYNADYLASSDDNNDDGYMILIFPTQDKNMTFHSSLID